MSTLDKFNNFVNEINQNNSRLYKISILEKYKDDTDIKYYLDFIFNPYIITGINDKKLNKKISCEPAVIELNTLDPIDALNYIKIHNTGRDTDIKAMQCFKSDFISENLYELFDKIITKNLPIGVDSKTINKVIPGLIPVFSVQLANKYFDKPEIVEGKEFAITTKIDGMRCVLIKEDNKVSFWSRQGQQIEGLVDLEAEAMQFPDNIVLDGELIAKETSKEETYKNTMKLARTKEAEKHNLKMMVFDILNLDEFKNQNCTLGYLQRRLFLDSVTRDKNLDYFEVLPILYKGSDTSKIIEILNEQTKNGEEGVMLNMLDAPYTFGRSNSLLKVKKFQDTEVRITGFEAGINKLSNTLGALICDYNGNELKVGSGFTDEERKYIWEHQEEYLGQLVVVKYFEETYNADGGKSLRFPIYLGIRIDL